MNELNRRSYDAIASQWDDVRLKFSQKESWLFDNFVAALSAGSEVLDLGCGTGRPFAEALLAREFQVTGVDQSNAMLSFARSRFAKGTWICTSIEEFQSERRFSGVVCWDSLFHIPRERHPLLLCKIRDLLLPQGKLLLTCGGSEHPAFQDRMLGETFFYDSFPPERLKSELQKLGFEILTAEFLNIPTDGNDKGRIAILSEVSSRNQ